MQLCCDVRIILLAILTSAWSLGCYSGDAPEIVRLRRELLFKSEPSGAKPIRDSLQSIDHVVIVGMIGAADLDPFVPGKAVFSLMEAPAGGHGHATPFESITCPFCRRQILSAPVATVEFVDRQGRQIAISAQSLFQVERGQIVVVVGRSEFNSQTKQFKIVANGMYLKGR